MKGILILELFGEDTRAYMKRYRQAFEACAGELGGLYFDETVGPLPKRSSWVAEIQGPDPQYGLARKFLRGKIDYSKSNGKGSRGIFAEFILSTGKIYQVRSQTSWKNADRFFCTVEESGDIIRLEEKFVCHDVFKALTKDEFQLRKSVKIAEITGEDAKYFFSRRFLNCDYSYIEGGEVSDYPGYTLQPGLIYEITKPGHRGRRERHYCIIENGGQERRMSEDSVCRALGIPTREERREKKIAERISRDKRP